MDILIFSGAASMGASKSLRGEGGVTNYNYPTHIPLGMRCEFASLVVRCFFLCSCESLGGRAWPIKTALFKAQVFFKNVDKAAITHVARASIISLLVSCRKSPMCFKYFLTRYNANLCSGCRAWFLFVVSTSVKYVDFSISPLPPRPLRCHTFFE